MKWMTPERAMWASAPPRFGADVFPGNLLDDVRAGDKHLRFASLNDEVGESGRVCRTTRAGAADQRDLGDEAAQHNVLKENAAVTGQRVDALLNACATGVIDKNEGRAGF